MAYAESIRNNDVKSFEDYIRGSTIINGRVAVQIFFKEYNCNTSQKILQIFVERFHPEQEIIDRLVELVVKCSDTKNLRYLNTTISKKAKVRGSEIAMVQGNLEALKIFKIEYGVLEKMYKNYKERIPLGILEDFQRYIRNQRPKRQDTSPEDNLKRILKRDLDRALTNNERRFTIRISSRKSSK